MRAPNWSALFPATEEMTAGGSQTGRQCASLGRTARGDFPQDPDFLVFARASALTKMHAQNHADVHRHRHRHRDRVSSPARPRGVMLARGLRGRPVPDARNRGCSPSSVRGVSPPRSPLPASGSGRASHRRTVAEPSDGRAPARPEPPIGQPRRQGGRRVRDARLDGRALRCGDALARSRGRRVDRRSEPHLKPRVEPRVGPSCSDEIVIEDVEFNLEVFTPDAIPSPSPSPE